MVYIISIMGKSNKKVDVNNKKFYAVTRGLNCGIFLQWSQVQPLVDKYKGAAHRGFVTLNQAVNFMLLGGYQIGEIYVHEDLENGTSMENVVDYAAKTGNTITGILTDGANGMNEIRSVDDAGISDSETDEKFVDATSDVTVFIHGCSLNNASSNQSKAGIGVYWGSNHTLNVSEPILNGKKTSNAAELQAAITAVQQIKDGNFANSVIKSDCQYLVNGITSWIEGWKNNNWITSSGAETGNKDLWLKLDELNTVVKPAWQYIPREQNAEADRLAKEGALKDAVTDEIAGPNASPDNNISGCVVCKLEENRDMLMCCSCAKRVHFACSELPDYQIKMFKKTSRKFTCQLCVGESSESSKRVDARKSVGEDPAKLARDAASVVNSNANLELNQVFSSCSTEDLNSIKEDVKDLKSTFSAFEQEILKLVSKLCDENVQTKINMSEERTKSVEKEKSALLDQIKKHTNVEGEMNVQIQNLREKNAKLSAECEQLRKCIERRDEAGRAHETRLQEKNAVILNFETEMARLKEENRILSERPRVELTDQESTRSNDQPTVPVHNRFERVSQKTSRRAQETSFEKDENWLYINGYREPLSNFYRMQFKWRGRNYNSVEQAFQHEKAVRHRAYNTADKILNAKHAGIAKKIGSEVQLHPLWDEEKHDILFGMLQEKAVQCKEFQDRLLESGDKVIYEDVPDRFWGIGRDGKGLNEMGKMLMVLREVLTKREEKPKVTIIGSSLLKKSTEMYTGRSIFGQSQCVGTNCVHNPGGSKTSE